MIINSEKSRILGIINSEMGLAVCVENGLKLKTVFHKDREIAFDDVEIFFVQIEEKVVAASEFIIKDTIADTISGCDIVSVTGELRLARGDVIVCKFSMTSGTDGIINVYIQMRAEWINDVPMAMWIELPFLSRFPQIGLHKNTCYYFKNPIQTKDGVSLMSGCSQEMPLGIFADSGGDGFSLTFPSEFPGCMNYNGNINRVSCERELREYRQDIRLHKEFRDLFTINIKAMTGGWPEFLSAWRREVRNKFDLNEYTKPEAQWYKKTYLHHFTYMFGKEIYNYNTGMPEFDRLSEDGREFGGYDAVVIWHQYPRLGADERSQWELFDDFPGGRKGLRKVTEQLHRNNTKVFLPFKPWDLRSSRSLDSEGAKLAELVKDTDIDGFFLDTMANVPEVFRKAVDQVKKGVVFCSEGQPHSKGAIELITGSWDQFGHNPYDIKSNMLRFIIPEHFAPVIARWAVGSAKDALIKRAIFNGTGMVIWQDVFGAWLPYSAEQKQKISEWKTILANNNDCFLGSSPIPFYPTLHEGLYCNYFPADDGDRAIFVFYNDTGEEISGNLAAGYNDKEMYVSGTVEAKDLTITIGHLNGKTWEYTHISGGCK